MSKCALCGAPTTKYRLRVIGHFQMPDRRPFIWLIDGCDEDNARAKMYDSIARQGVKLTRFDDWAAVQADYKARGISNIPMGEIEFD